MADLRIGIVGTGMIGRTHIERINTKLQGGRVIACADANIDFCKSVAEKYGLKAYSTGEEMITPAKKAPVFKAGKALKDAVNK